MNHIRQRVTGVVSVVAVLALVATVMLAGRAQVLAPGREGALGAETEAEREMEREAPGVREATSGISRSPSDATVSAHVAVVEADHHDVSPAVRSLPAPTRGREPIYPPEYEHVKPATEPGSVTDPVVQRGSAMPSRLMPSLSGSFPGISNPQGYVPPDTNGDVGPNHYVQTVNVAMRVWNKDGTPVTAVADINALWSGFGGLCETTNQGDPVVLYDPIANRWLISQFAFSGNGTSAPFYECVAVSTSANPAGTYYRYAFVSPQSRFPDYPKLGVWPDGYYMSTNEFSTSGSFVGVGAWAMDRAKMLNGQAATMQYFHLGSNYGNFLPADLDGATQPPAGAPNPFVSFDDWTSTPRLKVMNFHVDWNNTANTTFSAAPDLVTAAFDSNLCGGSSCVPQPSTSNKLDTLSDRLMFRLAYRNFGSYASMVVTHTVDANGSDRAGIRWYELRNNGGAWSIQQQGTYAPDATNRFLSAAAMDASGDIAVGYSASSGSVFPGLRFAGRLATDPAGQLSQGEGVLVAGGGSQTGGGGRWGDYASMSVDPTDDCTFWFTSEYYTSTSNQGWVTRIGSFKFPTCTGSGGGGGGGGGGASLSIGDVSVSEGNSGTTTASFPVTLSAAQSGAVSVNYATAAGTASAGSDFTATSGTLTLAAGQTSAMVNVPVVGDTIPEADETFTVNLSGASAGVTIADGQAIGTISDDDSGGGTTAVSLATWFSGGYGVSGDVTYFHRYQAVNFLASATPNLAGQPATFEVYRWNGSDWVFKGTATRTLSSSSVAKMRFDAYSLSRTYYAIRATYAGDTGHDAAETPWSYFKVTY